MNDPQATLLDVAFVQRAYDLAEAAVQGGNHPFGALLVLDGKVILEAQNGVETCVDVTRHAEIDLVSRGWRDHGREVLRRVILYSSTEPCLMCAGAIFWAEIPRVVFGVGSRALDRLGGRPYRGLALREIATACRQPAEVVGPVMEDDGLRVHAEYWQRSASPLR